MHIYINMRDLLTWPRAMADLMAAQGHEPIFVDNASTYAPLLDYYSTCPYRVERLRQNRGSRAVWSALADELATVGQYVVTDPDLDLSDIPVDWPAVLAHGLEQWPEDSKCGFSLDNVLPAGNPLNHDPAESWNPERLAPRGAGYFYYPIDTTFALYRAGSSFVIDGKRTDRPYTALHLPWYLTLDPDKDGLSIPITDEIAYYFAHCSSQSSNRDVALPMIAEWQRRKK
jgi:hypothetical protein